MKKLLSMILAIAMILTSMSVVGFADSLILPSKVDFAANPGKTVTDGTNYYTDLKEAVNAVHGIDGAVLYCAEGADVGSITHLHVCKDITIYGNGAYVSGGHQELEIGAPGATGNPCSGISSDITINVDGLDGIGAWGSSVKNCTVNLIFSDCNDMSEVYINGTNGVINMSLTNCSFTSNVVSNCKVYSKADGKIELNNVNFSNVDKPVRLNHGGSGVQTVNVTNCNFDTCGGIADDNCVPISVLSSAAGGKTELSVIGCNFTNTQANSIGQVVDVLLDYTNVGTTTAVIDGSNAILAIETENNVATTENLTAEDSVIAENTSTELKAPAAIVDGKYYAELSVAIDAAQDGDTITILPGTYDAFTVPETKNNLTFVGTTDDEGNNLVTIRTLEDDIATQTKGIYVQAEKATFKNLDIVSGSALVKWLCSALGATNNGVGLGYSKLNELIVEDCNFKGNGSKYAIWARACDITVTGTTIDGYTYGIESYNLGDNGDQEINITNTEITNVYSAIKTVNTVAGSVVSIGDSKIIADAVQFSGYGDVVIDESVLNNVVVVPYWGMNIEITDSALGSSSVSRNDNSVGNIAISEVFVENINDFAYDAKTQDIVFDSYYATLEDYEAKVNLKDVPVISDAVYVEFEDVTKPTAEGEKVYNINLKADLSQTINRLNSADLEFVLTTENGAIEYNVLASNDEVTINNVEGDRYEFHYAGKDDADSDTGNVITIGQVMFTGVGEFDFGVKVNETNVVHATTIGDNIVDTYLPNVDTTFVAEGELVIDDNTISDVVIEVPVRELEVQIDFNNAAEKNAIEYQDMTVVVSGGDLEEDIEIELGDTTYTTDVEIFGKSKAKYTVSAAAENKYVVTVSGALTSEVTYTVTVSGAGYRTVRKNITMNEDATVDNVLTYWNNVKDADGADYLAGDIVKDNTINVYDLSAVVSYFGRTNNTSAYSKYARYDLNRDGKIDSKDVAYVLVSWGK